MFHAFSIGFARIGAFAGRLAVGHALGVGATGGAFCSIGLACAVATFGATGGFHGAASRGEGVEAAIALGSVKERNSGDECHEGKNGFHIIFIWVAPDNGPPEADRV